MKPKRPQNENQSPRDILQNFTGKDLLEPVNGCFCTLVRSAHSILQQSLLFLYQ